MRRARHTATGPEAPPRSASWSSTTPTPADPPARASPSDEALLEVRGQARERERDEEEQQRDEREDLECVDLADPGRGIERQPLGLRLSRLEQLDPADHGGKRRVLDDVDEQADERREQPPERLREDHRAVAAHPAEAERRRRLVLLPRDRLHGAAGRLGDLRAPPEDQRDRRGGERAELERGVDRGKAEIDHEDRHENRQTAEDLDVATGEDPREGGIE